MFDQIQNESVYVQEHSEKSTYRYFSENSEESEKINHSLDEDLKELFIKLQTEKRMMSYRDLRDLSNNFFLKHSGKAPQIETKNFIVKNINDQYEIPARLYLSPQKSDQLIMFIHGGGWMQGSIDTHDCLCRQMAHELGVNIVSTGQRLAPENKFPKALEDVESVYKWCLDVLTSESIIENISKIYLSGDSSGGNLAAALNLKLRKENWGGKLPDGLILFYPVLSHQVNTKSFEIFKDQKALSAAGAIAFFEQYMGGKIDNTELIANELIFPLNGDINLYPNETIIIAAGCDVLLDGQLSLFDQLTKLKKYVKLWIEKGAVHGFMTYGKEFDTSILKILQYIKNCLNEIARYTRTVLRST